MCPIIIIIRDLLDSFHSFYQVVAVKMLNKSGLQGNKEFLVEVLMLSLLCHPNLVNMIGYCAEGDQRLLVYEFLPLGSLERHLHGSIFRFIIPEFTKYTLVSLSFHEEEKKNSKKDNKSFMSVQVS